MSRSAISAGCESVLKESALQEVWAKEAESDL